MVLVSKSPPQDFVLGVGAKLGREQKSTCKFSTGTHHTHPGFEAARRIDKQSPRIQKVFGLKFCKIKQNIRKEKFKTSQDGSFKEPCGSFKSQKVEVSRVCVQRNFSPCANKQRSQQVETKRLSRKNS